jgi:hypothetical protein
MLALGRLCLQALGRTLRNPIFLAELLLIYHCYRQDHDKAEARRLLLRSALEGIGIGAVLTGISVGLGIGLDPTPAILAVAPATWLLSLADRRFVCFSYGAAAVISLCRLLGLEVDGAGLAAIAGFLHLAEGILVGISGGEGRILRIQQEGVRLSVQPKFRRLWPVPLGLLLEAAGEGIAMPGWWPLFGSEDGTYGLWSLTATLGYEESVRCVGTERRQTRETGLRIGLYGAILFLAAIAEAKKAIPETAVLLWMLLGHEWMMRSLCLPNKFGILTKTKQIEGIQ